MIIHRHALVEGFLFVTVNVGLATFLTAQGVPAVIATIIGLAAHGLSAFLIKRVWVFRVADKPKKPMFIRFLMAEVVIGVLVLSTVWIGTEVLEAPFLYVRLAAAVLGYTAIYCLDRWLVYQ